MSRVINMAEERARRAGSTAAETARQRMIRGQVLADLLDDLPDDPSQAGGGLDEPAQQFQTLENVLDGLPPFGRDAA